MIVVPTRVSPPRSLPASPVLSAAPAVVIRQAVEPAAATPAVTLHSAAIPASSHSPSHSHAHSHSYNGYYAPTATVVATPAAVVDSSHHRTHPQPHYHHSHAQQPKVAVTAHPYCDHHVPVTYKQPTVIAADHHTYTPLVYAQPTSPASYYHLVYDTPPTAVTHYPATSTPSHYCPLDSTYPSKGFSMAVPQPSLSPPHKPTVHRLTPTTPPMSFTIGSGSAFTPVQPIALYPRTGIMIR